MPECSYCLSMIISLALVHLFHICHNQLLYAVILPHVSINWNNFSFYRRISPQNRSHRHRLFLFWHHVILKFSNVWHLFRSPKINENPPLLYHPRKKWGRKCLEHTDFSPNAIPCFCPMYHKPQNPLWNFHTSGHKNKTLNLTQCLTCLPLNTATNCLLSALICSGL